MCKSRVGVTHTFCGSSTWRWTYKSGVTLQEFASSTRFAVGLKMFVLQVFKRSARPSIKRIFQPKCHLSSWWMIYLWVRCGLCKFSFFVVYFQFGVLKLGKLSLQHWKNKEEYIWLKKIIKRIDVHHFFWYCRNKWPCILQIQFEIWNRAVSFLTSFESKNIMKWSLVNSIEIHVLGKTRKKNWASKI